MDHPQTTTSFGKKTEQLHLEGEATRRVEFSIIGSAPETMGPEEPSTQPGSHYMTHPTVVSGLPLV